MGCALAVPVPHAQYDAMDDECEEVDAAPAILGNDDAIVVNELYGNYDGGEEANDDCEDEGGDDYYNETAYGEDDSEYYNPIPESNYDSADIKEDEGDHYDCETEPITSTEAPTTTTEAPTTTEASPAEQNADCDYEGEFEDGRGDDYDDVNIDVAFDPLQNAEMALMANDDNIISAPADEFAEEECEEME